MSPVEKRFREELPVDTVPQHPIPSVVETLPNLQNLVIILCLYMLGNWEQDTAGHRAGSVSWGYVQKVTIQR